MHTVFCSENVLVTHTRRILNVMSRFGSGLVGVAMDVYSGGLVLNLSWDSS
jgi:hypothetical protein